MLKLTGVREHSDEALYADAEAAMEMALHDAMPAAAVRKALRALEGEKRRIHLLAIGKAAWSMAKAASDFLGDRLLSGLVITKYGHNEGEIPRVKIREAGHPLVDENSLSATQEALELADQLGSDDLLIFLISGGGSALFESPRVPLKTLQEINGQLLSSGADIVSMNMIRKRLSTVKGGRFAERCAPAEVYAIILSDILGDPPDAIASGPVTADLSSSQEAIRAVERWKLCLSDETLEILREETPKEIHNVRMQLVGSVSQLCASAEKVLKERGYDCIYLTDFLDSEAAEAGRFLGAIARTQSRRAGKRAYILGGETTVTLGAGPTGKGGRNQELVLAAVPALAKAPGSLLFSIGSDGTDGPTDAAGAIADSHTQSRFQEAGISLDTCLERHDAYNGFWQTGGLIMTGPTGTNVNDLTVLLVDSPHSEGEALLPQ